MPAPRSVMPFVAVVGGIAAFSAMDAVMKGASLATGVYTALLLRAGFGALLMAPLWRRTGVAWPAPDVLKVHLLRSAVVACMAPLFFWGLVRMPIAEAIALSFIAPLVALYLAAVLLKERIRPRAVVASLLGLAGVVLMVAARLGEGRMDARVGWGIAAVLASAVFYAWNLVLQRQQAQIAAPVEIALFQNGLLGLYMLPLLPWLGRWPDAPALGLIALAAVLASLALVLLSWGYARAEAQALVPIEYTGFIWAALFGWAWFDEAVTWSTLLGVVLIVGASWLAARTPGAASGP
jgi:S-adenosylmethionine uptake transporter